MKLKSIDTQLQELRSKWSTASETDRKIILLRIGLLEVASGKKILKTELIQKDIVDSDN